MASLLDQLKALQKSKFLRADRATAQIAQLRGEKLVDIFLEAGDNTELRKELFQTVSEVREELENNINRQDKDIADNKDELTNLITEKDAAVWAEFERRLKEGLIDKERFASSVTAGSQLMSQSLKESLEKLCTCQTEHSDALIAKLAELIQTIVDKPMGGGGVVVPPSTENYFSTPVILGIRNLKAGETGKWTISSNATGSISISGFDVTIVNEEGGEILSERLSATNDENRAQATLEWLVPADIEKSEIYTIKAKATGGNIVSEIGTFQISVALVDDENPGIPTPPETPVEVITKPVITGTTELTEGEKGTWTISAFTQVEEAIVNYFTAKIYNDQNALVTTQTVIPAEKPAPEEGVRTDFTPVEVTGTLEATIPVGIARTGTYRVEVTATDTGLSYTSEVGLFNFTVNKKIDIQYLGTPTVTGELDGRPGQTLTLTAHAETLTEDAEVSSFNIQFNGATSTVKATDGSAEFQVAVPAEAQPETSIRLVVTAVDQKNSYTSQALLIYVNVVKELGTNAWTTETPENLDFLPGYTEKNFSCGSNEPTGGIGPNACPDGEMQMTAGISSDTGCQVIGTFYWQLTGFDMQEKAVDITVPASGAEVNLADTYTILLDEILSIPETAVIGTKFKVCMAFTWSEDGIQYKHTLIDNILRTVKDCSTINPDDEPPLPTEEQLASGSDFLMPVISGPVAAMAGQEIKFNLSSTADKTITAFEVFFSNEVAKRSIIAVANKSSTTFVVPSDWVIGQAFRISAVAVAGSERSEMATKVLVVRELSYGDSTLVPAPTIEGPAEVLAAQTPSWSLKSEGAVSFDVKWGNDVVKTVAAINGISAFSKFIPSATVANTTFKLQVVAIDAEGGRTAIVSTNVKVVSSRVITPTITGGSYQANAIAFKPSAFQALSVQTETQSAARYRLLKTDNTVLYDSGEITDSSKFTTFTLDAANVPNFPGTGSYILQVSQKGTTLGWSDYGEVVATITGVNTPSITYPENNSTPLRAGLKITGTAFSPVATDTHDKSRLVIRKAADNSIVYDSGPITATTEFTLTTDIVINSNIQMNVSYKFEISYKGAKYGWSNLSPAVTVAEFSYDWAPQGQNQLFTKSGTFTVPAGVTSIGVVCAGGGESSKAGSSGGAGTVSSSGGSGSGGAAGARTACGAVVSGLFKVTPGETLTVTVGASGPSASASILGTFITAQGGSTSIGDYIISESFKLKEGVLLKRGMDQSAIGLYVSLENIALNISGLDGATIAVAAKEGRGERQLGEACEIGVSAGAPLGYNGGNGNDARSQMGGTYNKTGYTGGCGGAAAICSNGMYVGTGGLGGTGAIGGSASGPANNASYIGSAGGGGGGQGAGGGKYTGVNGGGEGGSYASQSSASSGIGGAGGMGGRGGYGANCIGHFGTGGAGGKGGNGGNGITVKGSGITSGKGGTGHIGGIGGSVNNTNILIGSNSPQYYVGSMGGEGGRGGNGGSAGQVSSGATRGSGGNGGNGGASGSASAGLVYIFW